MRDGGGGGGGGVSVAVQHAGVFTDKIFRTKYYRPDPS